MSGNFQGAAPGGEQAGGPAMRAAGLAPPKAPGVVQSVPSDRAA